MFAAGAMLAPMPAAAQTNAAQQDGAAVAAPLDGPRPAP
ncbi:hypothetical protein GGR49_002874 [Sphingomonas carotinifaciens]|nr:hypothetical protein [Sphingomonas carotinifaciens]